MAETLLSPLLTSTGSAKIGKTANRPRFCWHGRATDDIGVLDRAYMIDFSGHCERDLAHPIWSLAARPQAASDCPVPSRNEGLFL